MLRVASMLRVVVASVLLVVVAGVLLVVLAELFAEHRAFALLELAVLAVLLSLLLLLMPLLLPFHFSITRIAI